MECFTQFHIQFQQLRFLTILIISNSSQCLLCLSPYLPRPNECVSLAACCLPAWGWPWKITRPQWVSHRNSLGPLISTSHVFCCCHSCQYHSSTPKGAAILPLSSSDKPDQLNSKTPDLHSSQRLQILFQTWESIRTASNLCVLPNSISWHTKTCSLFLQS